MKEEIRLVTIYFDECETHVFKMIADNHNLSDGDHIYDPFKALELFTDNEKHATLMLRVWENTN